jgi:hypothetical protein
MDELELQKLLEQQQSAQYPEVAPTPAEEYPEVEAIYEPRGPGIYDSLDPNDPNYERDMAVLNSPEHKASIAAQKEKIAAFKAARQTQSEQPPVDNRIYDATMAGNKQEHYANLLRSFQNMIQSAAPNTGFKADYGVAESMSKGSGKYLDAVKAQMAQEAAGKKEARDEKESKLRQDDFQIKLEKSKLDFQDMEANRDPASPQSKLAQDRVLEVMTKLGKPLNEASVRQMSGAQLYSNKEFDFLQNDLAQHFKSEEARLNREQQAASDANRLAMEAERNKKLDAMEERRIGKEQRAETDSERRYRQQQINTARGMIKDDPRFKKSMEQSMAFEDVGQLISEAEKGNQQAVGALGTKLARAMGEVGVLTESDVTRYVAGQSWGRKLKDWFTKGAQGELSPETIKGIQSNLKILKSKLDGDVEKVVGNSAARMKAAYPEMEESDIRGILGFVPPKASESDFVMMQAPDGSAPVKVKKDQAQKYLDKGAKIVN